MKLSWTELRRALAVRAGVSEKEANAFLNAFQTQLVEALKQDKQVKVNGLGTFKLQAVAPRKSVNVKTGEEITIEGYNKIAFVPEAGVKELIESNQLSVVSDQPSAVSNQTKEIDPIKKLGEQADEIVDILGELGQSPEGEPVQEPMVEEPVQEPVEEPVQEPVVEEPVQEPEPEVIPTPMPEPVVEPQPAPQPIPEMPKKKEYHFLRDIIICVAVLLVLLVAGFFILRHQLSKWINGLINNEAPIEVVVENEEPVVEVTELDEPQPGIKDKVIGWYEAAKDWIMGYFEVAEVEVIELPDEEVESTEAVETEEPVVAERIQYTEFLLTERLTEGSRLAWVSKKYYGNIVYWPYLYDANRDRISNPSDIPVGTLIRVPKLTAAQRDTTSAAFQRLKEEAYGKVKGER